MVVQKDSKRRLSINPKCWKFSLPFLFLIFGIYAIAVAVPSANAEDQVTLSGVVTDASGVPIAQAWVTYRPAGASMQDVQTDSNGRYSIVVSPGQGTIEFRTYSYQGVNSVNTVPWPSLFWNYPISVTTDTVRDFTWPLFHTLRLKVVNSSGTPVPNAPISNSFTYSGSAGQTLLYLLPPGGDVGAAGGWYSTSSGGIKSPTTDSNGELVVPMFDSSTFSNPASKVTVTATDPNNPGRFATYDASNITSDTSVTTTLPDPPLAPTSLQLLSATQDSVKAVWLAPSSDGGSEITSYQITATPLSVGSALLSNSSNSQASFEVTSAKQVARLAAAPITVTGLSPTSRSYTIAGMVAGQRYQIAVSAVNAVGVGKPATSNATPAAVPATPVAPTATAGNTQATISWVAPANNGAAIDYYTVTQSTTSGGTYSATSASCTQKNALTCIATGLTNGTTYYFKIVAHNVKGLSSLSPASTLITPVGPQATLTIANTTLTGTAGTAIALSTSGGSGSGGVTYAVTGTGCSITSVTQLNASSATTCVVTATKAASTGYLVATSATKSFVFAAAAQATLTIANTTLTGTAGTAITLSTSGGSGSGGVTYAATGTGCSITLVTQLKASSATTCVVTATKAASTGFLVATSATKSFVFAAAPVAQATLTIANTVLTGTAGTAITLSTSGGSGSGAVSYAATGTGCSITSTNQLKASTPTTCVVTATKAASTGYLVAASATKSFVFAAAPVAQATLTIANTVLTGTAGTAITLSTSGGSGSGAVTYSATGSGCSITSTNQLKASTPTTCVVTATKAASTGYLVATSATKSFVFAAANQSTLSVSNSNTSNYAKGNIGLVLTTSGGSGTGAVTYAITGTGCTLVGTRLTVATTYKPGTTVSCSVVATKAASGIYGLVRTAAKAFNFR